MITLYLFDEEYKNSAAVTIDPAQVESAIATKRKIAQAERLTWSFSA